MIGHQVMTNPNLLFRSIIDFGGLSVFDDSEDDETFVYNFFFELLKKFVFAIKLFYCHFQHFYKVSFIIIYFVYYYFDLSNDVDEVH